jgi:hypothetical protein
MARAGSGWLDSGDAFPMMEMDTVSHGRINAPAAFGDGWGVFLVYRAHW